MKGERERGSRGRVRGLAAPASAGMELWGICGDPNTCGGLENIAKNVRIHKQRHTLAFLCVCTAAHAHTNKRTHPRNGQENIYTLWTSSAYQHLLSLGRLWGPLIPLCCAPCCVKARLLFVFRLCKTSCSLNGNLADFHPALYRHDVVSICKWTVVNPPFRLHLSPHVTTPPITRLKCCQEHILVYSLAGSEKEVNQKWIPYCLCAVKTHVTL